MKTEVQQKPMRRLEKVSGYSQIKEQLKQTRQLGNLLQQAESYALRVFPSFAHEIPELSLNDPFLPGVLLLGNYQGVDQKSDEYGKYYQAKSLRQKIAREVVRDIITTPDSQVEISPEQKTLLKYGLQIQDTVDDIHGKWHKELVRGENADEIRTRMEDDKLANELLGPHGDFLYGLIRKNTITNTYSYVPYANAYPEEIATISSLINSMIEEMKPFAQSGSDEAKAHIAVHQQWQKLLTFTGSPQEQEELGKQLDVIWMTQADALNPHIRSQILYPMETYAAGKSVEWQYDLLLKQPEYDQINKQCDETKQKMVEIFTTDSEFLHLPTLQQSLSILKATDSTVYLRFISGTPLGFRSAASNVPNRDIVRLGHDREDPQLANGTKINFDYVTFEQRAAINQKLLQNVFGQENAKKFFGNTADLIPLLIGRFVAGHEDAHNILQRSDTLRVLGTQNHIDLEEVKADLASEVTCFSPGFLGKSDQENLMKAIFAEELRGLSRWAERKVDSAHLNGNILTIQLMLDAGILYKSENGWNFDAEDSKKTDIFREGAKRILLDLAKAYEAVDPTISRKHAANFKTTYLNKPSKQIIQLVHDAGIISDTEYAQEIEESYPMVRRTLAA